MGEVHAGGGPRGLRLGSRLFAALALALGLLGTVAPWPAAAAIDTPASAPVVAPAADPTCEDPGPDAVVLFAGPNFAGACVALVAGEYGWAAADFGAVGDDNVESVKLGGRASLTLCADAYLGGDCLAISGDEPDLGVAANSASSAKVAPVACEPAAGEVTLFADVDFGGACTRLGAGEYDVWFEFGTVGNDDAESVRIGAGAAIALCLDAWLGVPCATLASDVPDLAGTSVGRNTASSASVFALPCAPAETEVAVYADIDFGGVCTIFQPGQHAFGPDNISNDNVESVKVGRSAAIRLCTDFGLLGTCVRLAGDVADLGSTAVGRNGGSSANVATLPCLPAPNQVALYADVGYDGACVTLAVGAYPDAGSYLFGSLGDNNAASAKVGSGVTLQLYRDIIYTGVSGTAVSDVPDLALNPVGRDTASSVRVLPWPDVAPPSATWSGPEQGATIAGRTVRLDALVSDSGGDGLDRVEFWANWAGAWEELLSMPISGPSAGVGWDSWDMCASGVPDGPVRLRIAVFDAAGNSATYSNRYIGKAYDCAATALSVSAVTAWVAGSAHSVTVTAKDSHGNVATGYRGRIHFTSSDLKAVLPGDYQFTAVDKGVHRFAVAATLKTAGRQAIRARDTVTGTITGLQSGINVSPATAASLSVSAVTAWVAGSAHSVTVTARDAYGNTATGYRGSVHFTSSDARAVLPANYKFTAADGGLHRFSVAATLKTAGTQWIKSADTVTAAVAGTQSDIVVTPAAAAALAVSAVTSWVAGSAHSVTVTARDAYGNTSPAYRGTVHFTSSDAKAILPGDYQFTAADNGVHRFTVAATLKTAGTQWITAADTVTATIAGTQSGIVVTPAAATTLSVSTVASWAAGSANSVTVAAKDAYGNTASGYRGTIHFTSSDAQAVLPADYRFGATDNGVHVFAGVILRTPGAQAIRARDAVTATITGLRSGIVVRAV